MADYRKLMPAHYKILAKLGSDAIDLRPRERRALERDYRFGAPGVSDDASMVDYFESPRPQLFPHVVRLVTCGWLVLRYGGVLEGKARRTLRVLDVGAGRGEMANIVLSIPKTAGCSVEYTGLDIDIRKAELFRSLYQASKTSYVVHDFREGLSFPDRSFEAVVSTETLEHVTRDEGQALIREIRRVLVPRGYLVLSTPDSRYSRTITIHHAYEWSGPELKSYASLAGFKVRDQFWSMVPRKSLKAWWPEKAIQRVDPIMLRAVLGPASGEKGGIQFIVAQRVTQPKKYGGKQNGRGKTKSQKKRSG
jgi:ubiquinone/menaquinone biosynthesis C-methylase UbiE